MPGTPPLTAGPNQPISHAVFGTTQAQEAVASYTLSRGDVSVTVLTFGATIAKLEIPDRAGQRDNIVLGYPTLAGYETSEAYFGATIGRYANRIARGRFTLGGQQYSLAINNPPNSLHGGTRGFDKVIWQVEHVHDGEEPALCLSYMSRAGEEGFPGRLRAEVTYTLCADNELRLDYYAETDELTIINLTNHSYFNLAGESADHVLDHELMLNADAFTPIDATLIPTGEVHSVAGTAFDFRRLRRMGARIREPDPQIVFARGYDHNFVLRGDRVGSLALAANVLDPNSGRQLEVWTTEPGVQFYSGNFLNGTIVGSGGQLYRQSAGFCLETQHFPDSPNRPEFPSVVLAPGERYRSTTLWRFTAHRS